MKYFLDTEFIEAPNHLDLISIGIVAEDGRELYGERGAVDWSKASQWVLDNVQPYLSLKYPWADDELRGELRRFVGNDPSPEFWGYYSAYDWVAVCWSFGTMMDLPKGWPYFCRDLRQALDAAGLQHIKQPDDMPHNALSDARWIAEAFKLNLSA